MSQYCGRRDVQPRVAVDTNAGLLGIGDHLSALVAGHPVAGAGLDERQILGADDPQCPPHREVFHQAPALVELVVQIGEGEAGHPCPQR